ncbi:hypothetical protein LTR56_024567 [Elasticomyces elasticus]|nr:hypothetical protein LTR56_024567 [Elasticomyces elasticus]KAK3647391.1 hypothetical protein LTR22_013822 [Elasticomyces elasticus]KAK4917671.1 hypothetical protein LTR49_014493 [Elasticomyces elasticus]KAK5742711.1 hypothetical protein LTS12_024130 [Elasticomyces elasticus]
MLQSTAPVPGRSGRWVISRFGPPSVVTWEVALGELPEAQPGNALVRIIAAGIAGPDNIQRAGGYPNERCRLPGFTPGYDFVGEVVQLGRPQTSISVGDRVAAMCMIGAHATHIELPVPDLLKIDRSDDVVKVCALPLNYMTAFGMLQRSGVDLAPGSSILIGSAAGGIGTAVAQIVEAFDMKLHMIGTCSPSKFDYVRSLGVAPIDRHDPNLWRTVRNATLDGQGVDVAYDAIGSEESLLQSHLATRAETGQVIAIGIMSDIATDGSGMTTEMSADELLIRRQLPRMSYWGVERAYHQDTRELWEKDFYNLLDHVRSGKLSPKIAKLLKLSDGVRAHELLVSGAGVLGKMIFIVDAQLALRLGVT